MLVMVPHVISHKIWDLGLGTQACQQGKGDEKDQISSFAYLTSKFAHIQHLSSRLTKPLTNRNDLQLFYVLFIHCSLLFVTPRIGKKLRDILILSRSNFLEYYPKTIIPIIQD